MRSTTISRHILNLVDDFFSLFIVDIQHWNDIAKFRRFLQRVGNNKLIFIDEIAIYAVMPPLRTLVGPGHEPLTKLVERE